MKRKNKLPFLIYIIFFPLILIGLWFYLGFKFIQSIVKYIKKKKIEKNIKQFEQNKHKTIYSPKYYDKYVKYREPEITKNSTSDKTNSLNEYIETYNQPKKRYESKEYISDYEKHFLTIIENQFGQYYRIQPQVALSSIVNKNKKYAREYQNELYRTLDIGIFDKKTFQPLLMIEINDSTHKQANRYERDLKVREILKEAEIPLLTFYTHYSNNTPYVIKRIKENLPKE